MIDFEKHLLELVARGTALNELLDNVTQAIEALAPDCVCTVLLLDEEQRRYLLSASGPSLPAEYMQALSGLEIGPNVGACGSAAFSNQTLIVEDVATDYRFVGHKEFVMSYGLRSCWSVPIRNVNGIVQGTFAMYHYKPARPQPAELLLVEAGARLAGNVVERLRSEQRLRETAERLELAERAAEFGIWEVQVPNGLVTVSKGFTTLIGLPGTSRQFPLGELEQMLHPDDRTAIRAAAARALETGTFEAEFRIVLPDGTIRWQRSQGRVELTDGAARRATGALIDITDEKALLIRLEEARTAAEALARAAQGAEHLELDRKNVLELVALDRPLDKIALTIARAVSRHPALASCSLQIQLPGAARISVSTHIAQPFARALAQIPIDGIRETLSATPIAALSDDPEWQRCAGAPIAISQERYLAAPIRQNKLVAGTIVVVLPAGQHVSVADGELLESWARFASLAIERRGLYEQLSFRAQYDDLTTLLNRASLYACLEAQIAAATQSGGAMAVMYFDLDSFKQINDRYGHAAGDAVLRTASQRMLHNIRCTDVAARVGGDEFVILLPGVSDRGDAVRSAELIGQAISEPMEIAGIDVRVGSSAGIAMYPADGRHADALLKAADAEMYRIKRSHRSESLR